MEVKTIKGNVCMSWKTVRLGDVCEVFGGYAFKSENFKHEGIPLLRISNIVNSEISFKEDCVYIEDSNLINLEKFKVIKGDILVALSGATTGKFGEYTLYDFAYLNQRVGLIRATDKMNQKYLLFYLNILKSQIEQIAQGAAQPNISTNEIENLLIPLPPLATQKRIAEILDAADALRRKDQELLKKYDELAQAIFIDMFGDPVKNEKGWEVKSLSEIMDVDAKGVDPNEMNGYNYIGLEHIEKDTGKILVIDKGKVVSNKFLFTEDHILYGKLRPYLNKVAVPNFSGICSTDIFPLKPKNKLMKQFLVSILRSKEFVNHSNTNAVGANLPRANKDVILNFRTIVPHIEAVVKYSNNIDFINKQKDLIENEILKSDVLFNSFIQKAFIGELVV